MTLTHPQSARPPVAAEAPTPPRPSTAARRRRRQLLAWSRTLHIYGSLAALMLILFFAATGFMMNHESQFGLDHITEREIAGHIPPTLLAPLDQLAVVEMLRHTYHARGEVTSFDADPDGEEVVVNFARPGEWMVAIIDRETGDAAIQLTQAGILARMAALHTGEDAGPWWFLVIDATSLGLIALSLTGVIMWSSISSRRRLGIVALLASVTIPVLAYLLLLP